jgi:sarcosine oxidase subunit alpha
MGVMRIEKGHVAGPELDGRTTAEDLGLGRLLAAKDFIGKRALEKPGLRDAARLRLVGLVPVDGRTRIRAGSQLLPHGAPPMLGHVTSQAYSPTLGKPIALALLSGGLSRLGEHLQAAFPLKSEAVEVTVVDPVFFDPEGKRLHG